LRIAKAYKIFFLLLLISSIFVIGNLPFSPFHKLNRSLTLPINRLKYSRAYLEGLQAENKRLREAICIYEIEKIKFHELVKENQRLKERLNLKLSSRSWKVVWVEIIEVYSHELLIDRGAKDGITIGLPVLSGNIVVGRISEARENRASVILTTHSNFSAAIRLSRSGLEGVTEGSPIKNVIRLKYIPKMSDVRIGDEVITSGRGGIFPEGLKVGTVTEVTSEPFGFFLDIKVKSDLALSNIQDVAILVKQ
jgi:rod shape-determining protein MreC